MNQPKNILIVRTDRIGDVVLSLPMASILKKHFPGCRISFLLSRYTEPLAINNPCIDEVITLIEKNGKPDISKNIYVLKNEFDAVIVAYPSYTIALMLFLSNIKIRIGTGYRWYSFFFNRKVYDHRKHGEHHELEYNVRLLQQLGISEEVNENNVLFGISPSVENRSKIERDFSGLEIDPSKKIIIVHPGSGGSAVDLPAETIRSIIHSLAKEPVQIIITGTESEKELCASLVVNNTTKNLAGNYNLGELIALIEKCDLMMANSTGPIHIAAALGKNVIGFYPKFTAASPKRWGPFTSKKIIFTPAIDCENCTRSKCEELRCMESIKAEDVVETAKNIIAKVSVENQ